MKKNIKILFTCVVGFALLVVLWFGVVPFIKPISFRSAISKYEYSIYSDHATICGYYGKKNEVVIPKKILGRKITKIDTNAFKGNTFIQKVDISDNVETIGFCAFGHCTSLKEVKFGTNLKSVEMWAFSNCTNLSKVDYNDGLINIGDLAFGSCTSLKECVLPGTIREIGIAAYKYSGLEQLEMKSGIESIGREAFRYTPWMEKKEEFAIAENEYLLGYNGDKKMIVIPDGISFVAAYFGTDSNVKEIFLPNSVQRIDSEVFDKCENLIVYIPDSVNWIAEKEYVDYGRIGITDDVSQLTIVTTSGSYAEQYAKEQGIKCEIVDQIEYPAE